MQRSSLYELQPLEHVCTSLLVQGTSTPWAKVDGEDHSGFMVLCKFGWRAFLPREISIWDSIVGSVATARNFAACDTMTECLNRIISANTIDIAVI